jgi:polyphosphate kinase
MADQQIPSDYEDFLNRELAFLAFARRVLEMVEDGSQPLMERVRFAGIVGMLHDEFVMKRMSGLKRQIRRKRNKRSLDGRTPLEEFQACREELASQSNDLSQAIATSLGPALAEAGLGIREYEELAEGERRRLREYFRESVLPVLTPLAVDAEHPFPFISSRGLNLAVFLPHEGGERFIRLKLPDNRPRWVPLEGIPDGFVPLEQVVIANLDLLFPGTPPLRAHGFVVVRGAEGEAEDADLTVEDAMSEPGSIVRQVSDELKARKFAGAVRLEHDAAMPAETVRWLALNLKLGEDDCYAIEGFLRRADLRSLEPEGRPELYFPAHAPMDHPRLAALDPERPSAIFEEIGRGDLLVHHPYQDFRGSVVRFLEAATLDPDVVAIKLTIYRTSAESPIVRALAEASRRGKQVAVVVEITARFDEAPNIAWGQYLEQEGVHVCYGVDKLKTHVKLALVVREEGARLRRYLHVGTGNYHSGTARIYEDLGLFTADPALTEEAAAVFNELTGSMPFVYRHFLIAPHNMRERFQELIRREAENARQGRPAGIRAKMNQLQDPWIIRELYAASQAGVPITVNVRGLNCLRPGVEGLSETIRVFGVIDRFLEHSRIYRFENAGQPEYYIGSADWMARNLNNRVESIAPVLDPELQRQLGEILHCYERDNTSVFDCDSDGNYTRRQPAPGEAPFRAQAIFIERAERS